MDGMEQNLGCAGLFSEKENTDAYAHFSDQKKKCLDVVQGCFACAQGKTTTGPGTACEYCPADFVMKNGAAQCEPCTSLSPEKTVKIGAIECGDVMCRPDATGCLEQAAASQASMCTRDGFGWSYTLPGICDVCALNFFSTRVVSTNGLVSFNRCEECPQQFYTSDIGMNACLRCPDFHVRKPGDPACTLCAAGIFPQQFACVINA